MFRQTNPGGSPFTWLFTAIASPFPDSYGEGGWATGATSEDLLEEEAEEDSSSEFTVCVSLCTVVKEGDAKPLPAAPPPPGMEWRPRGGACSRGAEATSEEPGVADRLDASGVRDGTERGLGLERCSVCTAP